MSAQNFVTNLEIFDDHSPASVGIGTIYFVTFSGTIASGASSIVGTFPSSTFRGGKFLLTIDDSTDVGIFDLNLVNNSTLDYNISGMAGILAKQIGLAIAINLGNIEFTITNNHSLSALFTVTKILSH